MKTLLVVLVILIVMAARTDSFIWNGEQLIDDHSSWQSFKNVTSKIFE